jgi:hypothetical protein
MADGNGTSRGFPWGDGWLAIAPRDLPSLSVLLDDVGASPRSMAAHLGVSERSVLAAWTERASLPRACHLAVFYETKWGRSFVDSRAHNDAVLYGTIMLRLKDEVERLRGVLAHLGKLGEFGSANDPSPDIVVEGVPSSLQLEQAAALLGIRITRGTRKAA